MVNYFLVNVLMLIGLISIASLLYLSGRDYFTKHPILTRVFFGIYAGVAGAILMNQSFETSSGVLIGYRNYNVGIAALFGGAVPASIASIIMFFNRVLVIGFNRTTFALFFALLSLTIGSTLLSKYVKKFLHQWICFCVFNVAVISVSFYFLNQFQSNSLSLFVYFYTGHLLLAFLIYFILKYFDSFIRNYHKLAKEYILNTHDPLTGLKNRNALRILKEELKGIRPESEMRSVISIDIDNFRIVNDALGHQAGDQMIIDLSQKIKSYIGEQGDVYHVDGDEFVVILRSTDSGKIQAFAKAILHDIADQIMIKNRLYFLTASIGVCIGAEGETLDQTIENADTALYLAKKKKNSFKIYSQEMEKSKTREAILEEDLRCALEQGQLELHYQPIYDVRKGVINQAEALLRWNHPEFGRISPVEFIPIAERTKVILPITDWVINQSCRKLVEWKAFGIESMIVSVNLTFLSFENRSEELMAHIVSSIQETGIDPSITIKAMNWSDAQQLVATGEADALMQINETEERKLKYDFSDPLLETKFSIFASNQTGITGVESLQGFRVGVEEKGFSKSILKAEPQIKLIDVPTIEEGFQMLARGDLDAVAVDQWVGGYILSTYKIDNVQIVGEPIAQNSSAFAVKKGNQALLDDINRGLREMKEDGTYQQILMKWEPDQIVFMTRDQIEISSLKNIITWLEILALLSILFAIVLFYQRKKINQAKELFEDFFNINLDLLCITNLDGEFIRVNKAWESTLGYAADFFTGKRFWEFIHPDDMKKTMEAVSQLEQKDELLNFINRYRCKDGSYRFIEWRSHPKGKLVYAAARDITKRIQDEEELQSQKEQYRISEEKYRLIAEHVSDVISIFNVSKKCFTYYSPSVEAIRGYTVEEAMTETQWDHLHPEDAKWITEKMIGNVQKFLQSPAIPIEEVFEARTKHKRVSRGRGFDTLTV